MITHCCVMMTTRYIITRRKRRELLVMKPLLNLTNEEIMVGFHGWHLNQSTMVMTSDKQKLTLKMI